MGKSIEKNKLTVTIKKTFIRIQLYWKFICTNKSNDKSKTNLHSFSSTLVTVFLNPEKLLSL